MTLLKLQVREGDALHVGDRTLSVEAFVGHGVVCLRLDGEPEAVHVTSDLRQEVLPGVEMCCEQSALLGASATLTIWAPRRVPIRLVNGSPA